MMHDEFRPRRRAVIAAVAVVMATYVYFLIFAQFCFLDALEASGASELATKFLLTLMGVGGIGGSALAACRFSVLKGAKHLQIGFGICGAAALLTLVPGTPAVFYPAALAVGLGLGITTVTLASLLRRTLGGAHLGTVIGLGTGLAYAFCNLPRVFTASVPVQTTMAVVAALVGLIAARDLMMKTVPDKPTGFDYTPNGMGLWVVVLFGLVCLDSAAFYIIQHGPAFSKTGWGQQSGLFANAGVHLIAALLTGYALNQRWVGRAIFAASVLLIAACYLFARGADFTFGTILYTAAVSAYSTILVFYPARSMRPWLAAAVYGVSGWIGSGIGIAVAQGLTSIPRWLMLAAAVVVFGGLLVRSRGHANQLKTF